ncbi:hypothetical protein [Winogradskyella vidalii]|uniref:hypothetical protein n=1 Tax=Winogradskyella vidalii TaxID=2615024 RepID=UPI0015C72481|nr:hypothetical protein [Winogradskyella vidalii]
MKKFNLLIGIFIYVITLSCSSDDSNEQSENATIFGEWKLTSKLIDGSTIQLGDCEQGEGVIFLENLIANFIIVDEIGTEPDITQDGFENCDFRYATYDFVLDQNDETLYRIVEGEGNMEGVDDSITTFEIEVLTSQNLRIKSIAQSNTGSIEDVEMNSVDIPTNEQFTLIYTR